MKRLLTGLLLVATLGTAVVGCRNLDPSGVYKGDAVLAAADQVIGDSYDIVDLFLTTELANRASLPIEVTKAADQVRLNYPKALRSIFAARKAYIANPTDGTAINTLKTATSVLRSILASAQQYVPKKTSELRPWQQPWYPALAAENN